jgi:hypothetical protein
LLSVLGFPGACFSNRSYLLKRKSRSGGATFEPRAGEKELALQQLETGLRAYVASVALSYTPLKLLPFWEIRCAAIRASRKSSLHSRPLFP